MKTLLLVANVDWYVISHRAGIIKKAVETGMRVIVACENSGRKSEIQNLGAEFIDLKFSRSGINPILESITLFRFLKLYITLRPDIVHHVSLKPVVYGSFVAKIAKVKSVLNAVSGLGYVFTGKGNNLTKTVMLSLMKYSFNRKNIAFIFQNKDDYNELNELGAINSENKIYFIKGSGIDLNVFNQKSPPEGDRVIVLFPSRMLWDKGVRELKEASEILKDNYHTKMTFILAGMADNGNKAAVPPAYLKNWEDGVYVKWIGHSKNMLLTYEKCHIVVLPSYREGLPKSLIEASAMGKPIVTTDAIGCRECVDEGINGFKVPVKSGKSIAKVLAKLIDDKNLRIAMGKASRLKAEREFNLDEVINKHMIIYNSLTNASQSKNE